MTWNADDASRQSRERLLQQQQQQQQQQRFHRDSQQRAAKQMSNLMAQYRLRRSRGAESGPLTPERPIGEPPAEPEMPPPAPSAGSPESAGGLPPGRCEVRGTVLDVTEPVVNVNPWLVIDIRTDEGETMAVRGWFFWGTIRAPHVAAGHHIRVGGRLTGQGYIKPSYIINESTGSRWRRWFPFP